MSKKINNKGHKLLIIVLVAGLAACSVIAALVLSAQKNIFESAVLSDTAASKEEENGADETESLVLGAILKLLDSAGASNETVQNLFTNYLIYKSEETGEYKAAAIKSDTEHNTYDWKYLSTEGGRWSYDDNKGTSSVLGIDVSSHQGEINWDAVAADEIEFAIIRVAYRGYGDTGNLNEDKNAVKNIEGALAAGIDVGVYVFSQALTKEEVLEEAEMVLEIIDGYDITYPVVFDMEKMASVETRVDGLTKDEITILARTFCNRIEEAGYRTMVYTNMCGAVEHYDLNELYDAGTDLWFAQYYSIPFFPYRFSMLQYSETGIVDGIEENVDMNICFVDHTA